MTLFTALLLLFGGGVLCRLILFLFSLWREDRGTSLDRIRALDSRRPRGVSVSSRLGEDGVEEIYLCDAAFLWCNDACGIRPAGSSPAASPAPAGRGEKGRGERGAPPAAGDDPLPFNLPITLSFWAEHGARFPERYRGVLKDVLVLLEREGADAPSVVRLPEQRDHDNAWKQGHFQHLQTVSLLKHSVDTARAMAIEVSDGSLLYYNGLIAALSHDLGKLPGHRDTCYALRYHAPSSAAIAELLIGQRIAEPERDAILCAIRHHHDAQKTGDLLTPLKKADAAAREAETAEPGDLPPQPSPPVASLAPDASDAPAGGDPDPPPAPAPPSQPSLPGMAPPPAPPPSDGEEKKTRRRPDPSNVVVPFFDEVVFLARLRGEINPRHLDRADAFSMLDGKVYCTAELVFQVFKGYALESGWNRVELFESNMDRRQDLLLYLVNRLRKVGAIAEELLPGDTFYCRAFQVNLVERRRQSSFRFYFIPFRAAAFTANIMDLEEKKFGKLKYYKSVEPR